MQYNATQCKEPIEPQDSRELRDPRNGGPNERSQGTQAEGRKCHRVSFAKKDEGEARIQAEGRMRKDSGRGGWREDERRKGKEAGGIA